MSVYNSHKWEKSQFSTIQGYWDSQEYQRNFVDELGNQLGFKQMDDWYNIVQKDIMENGGCGLLNRYGGSPPKLIMSVYGYYRWNRDNFHVRSPCKLPKRHQTYWDNKDNRLALISNLTKELKITDLSDWYRISWNQIQEVNQYRIAFQRHPLEKFLQ